MLRTYKDFIHNIFSRSSSAIYRCFTVSYTRLCVNCIWYIEKVYYILMSVA